MSSDLTVKVAVENTTYVFDKLFDYLVPSAFTDSVQVGKRVLIRQRQQKETGNNF